MALTALSASHPFKDYFISLLPPFHLDIFGGDTTKIESFYSGIDTVFGNIYDDVENFFEELDVETVSPKFLYQLGFMIGADVQDLSIWLLSDGTVDTTLISQADFDIKLAFQQREIRFAIYRYIEKGTNDSIERYFLDKGIDLTIEECWFSGITPTVATPYSNASGITPEDLVYHYGNHYVSKYLANGAWTANGEIDAIGGIPTLENVIEPLQAEIFADIPSVSGNDDMGNVVYTQTVDGETEFIPWIKQLEDNNYGYRFLLTNSNRLFMRKSLADFTTEEWVETTGVWGVSGTSDYFELIKDKIFMKLDTDNFSVLSASQLVSGAPVPDFSIDNTNCYYFHIFDEESKYILDRGTFIEFRNTSDHQILGRLVKPSGVTGTITSITLYRDSLYNKEYLIADSNHKCFIVELTPDKLILLKVDETTLAESQTLPSLENYELYRISDSNILIMECKYVSPGVYNYNLHNMNFGSNYHMVTTSTTPANPERRIIKRIKFGNVVLNFSYKNKLYVTKISDSTMTQYVYTDVTYSQTEYTSVGNVFLLDKCYVLDWTDSGNDTSLYKLVGFGTELGDDYYKSHKFDITINTVSSNAITAFGLTSDALIESFVRDKIKLLKPRHTKINNFYI